MGLPDEQRRRQWSKRGSRLHRLRGIRERNVSAVEVWQACRARRLVAPGEEAGGPATKWSATALKRKSPLPDYYRCFL